MFIVVVVVDGVGVVVVHGLSTAGPEAELKDAVGEAFQLLGLHVDGLLEHGQANLALALQGGGVQEAPAHDALLLLVLLEVQQREEDLEVCTTTTPVTTSATTQPQTQTQTR